MKVNDYYTAMSSLWEEIDSMNMLPVVTTTGTDVTALFKAIEVHKEEARLFQFLNGKQKVYDKPLQCTACGIKGHSKEWC